jgi:hypothetical protein
MSAKKGNVGKLADIDVPARHVADMLPTFPTKIDLLCPDFNLKSAKTDYTTIKADQLEKICLATPSVLDYLFNQFALDIPKSLMLFSTTSGRHMTIPMQATQGSTRML